MGVSSSGGLLAVHAHPDDETLATGALLATWAQAGRPVTVVTCTRGEQGEVIGADLAHLEGDGPALAAHRESELASALVALGVTDHVYLDQVPWGEGALARFSDSGMVWAGDGQARRVAELPEGAFTAVPLDDAAGRLARVLRARRPEVVVTYEPQGGYGHPDHVRAHEVTMRAVELAADAGWAPAGTADGLAAGGLAAGGLTAGDVTADAPHGVSLVLWAARGESALRRAHAQLVLPGSAGHLRAVDTDLVLPASEGPLPSVAVPDDEIDLVVEVRPVLDRLVRALAAHATQVHAVTAPGCAQDHDGVIGSYALSNDVLVPLLSVEQYRVAPRPPHAPPARPASWPAGVREVA